MSCSYGCEQWSIEEFQAMEKNGPFIVTGGVVNVREKPDLKSKKILQVKKGDIIYKIKGNKEKVKVSKWEGHWWFVEYKGFKGWMLDAFLKPTTWDKVPIGR
jgi:hypothetical protein